MLKVYLLANGEREKVYMTPHNGPLIHDRTLTAGAIHFPQQNDILSGIMLTTVVPVSHEDYVHKLKCLVSGISKKENTGELALVDRDLLLTASSRISASDADKAPIVTGISRVLLGGMGVDIMSFTMMKQILCSPPFLKEVVLLSRVQHELCCILRDYCDTFGRNGLSVRRVSSLFSDSTRYLTPSYRSHLRMWATCHSLWGGWRLLYGWRYVKTLMHVCSSMPCIRGT